MRLWRKASLAAMLMGILSAASSIPAFADGAPMFVAGKTLTPGDPNTPVVMDWERVEAVLDGLPESRQIHARVTASFRFRNTTGAVKQTVGFPAHGPQFFYFPNISPQMQQFQVKVDGKPVEARGMDLPSSWAGLPEQLMPWYVWDMSFGPQATSSVEASYEHDVSAAGAEPLYYDFNYVLVTGALWKEPIGKAEIVVKLPPWFEKNHLLAVQPAGYRVSGNTLSWDLSNFEPATDVGVAFMTPGSWQRLEAARKIVAGSPNDPGSHLRLAQEYARLPARIYPMDQSTGYRDMALAEAEASLKLDPKNVPTLLWLGSQYEQESQTLDFGLFDDGSLEKAISYYQRAASVAPEDIQVSKALRRAYVSLGRLPLFSMVQPSKLVRPRPAEIARESRWMSSMDYLDKALSLQGAGDAAGRTTDNDIEAVRKAIYVNLARFAIERGDTDRALELARVLAPISVDSYSDYIGQAQGLPDTMATLARTLASQGRLEDALEVYGIGMKEWYRDSRQLQADMLQNYSKYVNSFYKPEVDRLLESRYASLKPPLRSLNGRVFNSLPLGMREVVLSLSYTPEVCPEGLGASFGRNDPIPLTNDSCVRPAREFLNSVSHVKERLGSEAGTDFGLEVTQVQTGELAGIPGYRADAGQLVAPARRWVTQTLSMRLPLPGQKDAQERSRQVLAAAEPRAIWSLIGA
ncbi:MAG: hypothetical protein Q7R39_15965, partial [Dehalococcoidia bacterium]|nr:hypothetical protein [Dehalococcoidia bacterium]